MEQRLRSIIKWLAILAFISPLLIFSKSFVFPFIVLKVWYFRSIVLLMLGAYILLLLHKRQTYTPKFTWIHWAMLAFLGSYAISTFMSVDWHRSFWATHERMLGLFSYVHYVLFFFIVSAVIRTWEEWRSILRWVLALGGVVMVIALLQQVNPKLLLNRGTRSASTLGNPIYVGGYGMTLALIGYFLAIKEKAKNWRIYAIAGGLLGLLGMFASGTRGSILGLFSAITLMLIIYFATLKKEHIRFKKWLTWITVGFIALLGVLFFFRESEFVKGIPGIGRVFSISFESRTFVTRTMAWDVALDGWQEHKLFGWGPNTFFYLFNKYYRPEFLSFGYQETWFDNAHNAVVNTLATQGIVGIVTYMGIFMVPCWVLLAAYRRKDIGVHLFAVGTGYVAGHFVHNAFVFENPSSLIYFALLLGFIAQQTAQRKEGSGEKGSAISTPTVIVTAVGIFLLIFTTNINHARANHHTILTMRELNRQSKNILEFYETQVLTIPTPHYDEVRVDMGRGFTNVIGFYAEQNRIEEAKALFITADEGIQVAMDLHPLDVRLYIQRAEMYRIMGGYASDPTVFYQESERVLRQALELSPERQQLRFLLSANMLLQNRPEEAQAFMKEAAHADPKVGESWWRYAATFSSLGDLETAKQIILEGKERGAKYKKTDRKSIQQLLGVGSDFTDQLK